MFGTFPVTISLVFPAGNFSIGYQNREKHSSLPGRGLPEPHYYHCSSSSFHYHPRGPDLGPPGWLHHREGQVCSHSKSFEHGISWLILKEKVPKKIGTPKVRCQFEVSKLCLGLSVSFSPRIFGYLLLLNQGHNYGFLIGWTIIFYNHLQADLNLFWSVLPTGTRNCWISARKVSTTACGCNS